MIYLPLDKLIAQTAAESAAGIHAPAAPLSETSPANEAARVPEPRGRENRSIRDRESR
jgi:hypothetical protein